MQLRPYCRRDLSCASGAGEYAAATSLPGTTTGFPASLRRLPECAVWPDGVSDRSDPPLFALSDHQSFYRCSLPPVMVLPAHNPSNGGLGPPLQPAYEAGISWPLTDNRPTTSAAVPTPVSSTSATVRGLNFGGW